MEQYTIYYFKRTPSRLDSERSVRLAADEGRTLGSKGGCSTEPF